MKNPALFLISLFIALLATFISISSDSIYVENREQLRSLKFGAPITLVEQSQYNRMGLAGGELEYPHEAKYISDIWDYPISIVWVNMAAFVTILTAVIFGLLTIRLKSQK